VAKINPIKKLFKIPLTTVLAAYGLIALLTTMTALAEPTIIYPIFQIVYTSFFIGTVIYLFLRSILWIIGIKIEPKRVLVKDVTKKYKRK